MTSSAAAALRNRLMTLYSDASKHSSYQTFPDFVARYVGQQVSIDAGWRGDRVRLRYIEAALSGLDWRDCIDFGANTGFFGLSLARKFPTGRVLAIEANPVHAQLITDVAHAFHMSNVEVIGRPLSLDDLPLLSQRDVLLHLNVLHHAGSDFDSDKVKNNDDFVPYAREYLSRLRQCSKIMIFQMGTNRGGDKSSSLFDYEDDVGKLIFISEILRSSGWEVVRVAYPTRPENDMDIEYRDIPREIDLADPDAIGAALHPFRLAGHRGEFYRRPIFVCSAVTG